RRRGPAADPFLQRLGLLRGAAAGIAKERGEAGVLVEQRADGRQVTTDVAGLLLLVGQLEDRAGVGDGGGVGGADVSLGHRSRPPTHAPTTVAGAGADRGNFRQAAVHEVALVVRVEAAPQDLLRDA